MRRLDFLVRIAVAAGFARDLAKEPDVNFNAMCDAVDALTAPPDGFTLAQLTDAKEASSFYRRKVA